MTDRATWTSDGDEIAISEPNGSKYASVFLSKNRRRFGIRNRHGYTFLLDAKVLPRLEAACRELAGRLDPPAARD